jgi:hypothetical protein
MDATADSLEARIQKALSAVSSARRSSFDSGASAVRVCVGSCNSPPPFLAPGPTLSLPPCHSYFCVCDFGWLLSLSLSLFPSRNCLSLIATTIPTPARTTVRLYGALLARCVPPPPPRPSRRPATVSDTVPAPLCYTAACGALVVAGRMGLSRLVTGARVSVPFQQPPPGHCVAVSQMAPTSHPRAPGPAWATRHCMNRVIECPCP